MNHRSFLAMASALLLGLLMAALASTTSAGQSTAKKIQLKAFDTVQICTPLSVLILPLSQDSVSREESPYSLAVEGEAALHQSIRGRVSKGVLYIESAGSFDIHENAKITVALPYNALKSVDIKSSTNVFISKGFTAPALELAATSLGGAINADGLTVSNLILRANGISAVTVTGVFNTADIFADATASVQVSGVTEKATVMATGAASVGVVTTTAGAVIEGTTQGSTVLYNQGTCKVKGGMSAAGLAACKRDAKLKLTAAPMKWTCHASSKGAYQCGNPGSSVTSFSSVGSDCQGMEPKAAEDRVHTSRRLQETSISSTTSTSGGESNAGTSTFTYTSNTPSGGGQTQQTVCNFVNNVGSCSVNGTPVPVRQYGLGASPAPAPSTAEAVLNAAISSASTSNAQVTATTSPGGTVCTFVNGIGGCSAG